MPITSLLYRAIIADYVVAGEALRANWTNFGGPNGELSCHFHDLEGDDAVAYPEEVFQAALKVSFIFDSEDTLGPDFGSLSEQLYRASLRGHTQLVMYSPWGVSAIFAVDPSLPEDTTNQCQYVTLSEVREFAREFGIPVSSEET